MMQGQIEMECSEHSNLKDCPDSLIYKSENKELYGIRIHDGGSSFVAIEYCPWCGSQLTSG